MGTGTFDSVTRTYSDVIRIDADALGFLPHLAGTSGNPGIDLTTSATTTSLDFQDTGVPGRETVLQQPNVTDSTDATINGYQDGRVGFANVTLADGTTMTINGLFIQGRDNIFTDATPGSSDQYYFLIRSTDDIVRAETGNVGPYAPNSQADIDAINNSHIVSINSFTTGGGLFGGAMDVGDWLGSSNAPIRDDIVEGTDGDDTIDLAYTGDPEGDRVDNLDSTDRFTEGLNTNNDSIRAGDGNDTIDANASDGGADTIHGGSGDDVINSSGNTDADTVIGGTGNDDITAGNGGDSIDGGDGADTVSAAGGRDSVLGGAGNDSLDGGGSHDTLAGGSGSDTLIGGGGNDTLFGDSEVAGATGTTEYSVEGYTFGRDFDLLTGNFDNPTTQTNRIEILDSTTQIRFVDDDATAHGDGGIAANNETNANDTDQLVEIDGQLHSYAVDFNVDFEDGSGTTYTFAVLDVDLNDDGDFADADEDGRILVPVGAAPPSGATLTYVDGSLNTVENPSYASLGAQTVDLTTQNDSLDGGNGNDVLDGGGGDDTLSGGIGNNTVTGGDGNDRFEFTQGEQLDISDFGDGSTNADDGDNTNNDFIDLTAYYSTSTQLKADLTDDGIANQSAGGPYTGLQDITDGGASTGITGLSALQNASDSSIEEQTGVPLCLTPDNLVLTHQGYKPVKDLEVGDRVQTRDNGYQPIRWIYSRHLSGTELIRNSHLEPILIRKDSLGEGVPERDMLVSPGHMFLTNNRKALRAWKQTEALVPAKRLTGSVAGVGSVLPRDGVSYIHLLFDRHEIIKADGAWTESFRPGEFSLMGLGSRRNEVYEIFPELRHKDPESIFAPARESFYAKRANRLARRIGRFGMLQ